MILSNRRRSPTSEKLDMTSLYQSKKKNCSRHGMSRFLKFQWTRKKSTEKKNYYQSYANDHEQSYLLDILEVAHLSPPLVFSDVAVNYMRDPFNSQHIDAFKKGFGFYLQHEPMDTDTRTMWIQTWPKNDQCWWGICESILVGSSNLPHPLRSLMWDYS